jgi:DnaJ-domain-containing protein 1
MARMKLMARKHVRAPPRRNVVPTKSHSDGQDVGYFSRILRTVLLVMGSNEPPLFIGTPRLLRGNSYLWRVRVVIYERPTTDRIYHICQVVEAPAPRWTFEAGMREAAREALVILRHEVDEQMANSQYHHFPSQAEEGAEAVILPAGGHNHMGCFADQVKLTHALVRNLDEALKEVKLLGEHEEESSRKIIELEALCKKLRDDTQRLEEEMATLEEMVESRDDLLMEIAREMGLDRMGEDEEEEEEDADDGGDAAVPPATTPPPPMPPAAVPEEINEEGPIEAILEQGVPMPHEVIMAEAEPKIPQLRLYRALMRDYEENPLRQEDDFDDLNDYPNGGRFDVDE